MGITTALPSGLSSKTQKLSHWLANTSKALRHILIVIDGESRSSGTKVTLMKLQPMPGFLKVPPAYNAKNIYF